MPTPEHEQRRTCQAEGHHNPASTMCDPKYKTRGSRLIPPERWDPMSYPNLCIQDSTLADALGLMSHPGEATLAGAKPSY